jgi:hypothetical protein
MPGMSGMSGFPGVAGIGALMLIFIEQQLPQQAMAVFVLHNKPQQLRTEVATNFIMRITPSK